MGNLINNMQAVRQVYEHYGNALDAYDAGVHQFESLPLNQPIDFNSHKLQEESMSWFGENILYAHSAWSGLYSGLYSVKKKGMVPKPTEDCLGDWIADDMMVIEDFRMHMRGNYFGVGIDEYQKTWNSLGDLMFKNFDECHFKAV